MSKIRYIFDISDSKVKPEMNGRSLTPEVKTKPPSAYLNGKNSSPTGTMYSFATDEKIRTSTNSGGGILPPLASSAQNHLFSDLGDGQAKHPLVPGNKSSSYFADVIRNLSEYSTNDTTGKLMTNGPLSSVLDSYYLSSMQAAGRGQHDPSSSGPSNLGGSLPYTPDTSPSVGCTSSTDLSAQLQCSLLYGTPSPSRSVYLSSCKTDHPKSLPSISEFGVTLQDRRSY